MKKYLIRNGRVIDPAENRDEITDILVENGVIKKIAKNLESSDSETIDAKGLIVSPGFIDMQVHFREPGQEEKETLETGSRACLKGGITTAVAMPNTTPVVDNKTIVEFIKNRSQQIGLINILPTGSITKGQSGKSISNMNELKEAGAIALTDDGVDVENEGLLRHAMEYSKTIGILLMSHCETPSLTEKGVMHEGWGSTQLGLSGTPAISEELAIEKNVQLAKLTGAKLHLLHISTAGGIQTLRCAKKEGFKNITGEVSVQHFSLTDEECMGYNTNAKMYPPLRSQNHLKIIIEGIRDGTIDIFTTDHAPHTIPDKLKPFANASMGSTGVETFFAVINKYLVEPKYLSLSEAIAKITINPARILKIDKGSIGVEKQADITIFDPEETWIVDKNKSESKGKNCVFHGKKLIGKVKHVFVNGTIKLRNEIIL